MTNDIQILIVKPSSLGDIIQCLQTTEAAGRALQNEGKKIHIDWIVRDTFAPILKSSPYVQNLLIFKRHGGIKSFLQLLHEIRKKHYDYVLDFQGLLRSGIMTFFSHGNRKIGRTDAREGSKLFYQKHYGQAGIGPHHAVENLTCLWNDFNLNIQAQRPLTLKPKNLDYPWMQQPYIALFPQSRRVEKEWPYFEELTQFLLQETPFYCVWFGNKTSKNISIKHSRFVDCFGATSLEDLPYIIQKSYCIIANDSGPIHLAAALKKPLVGFYGPTDENRFGPYPLTDTNHKIFKTKQALKDLTTNQVCTPILAFIQSIAHK